MGNTVLSSAKPQLKPPHPSSAPLWLVSGLLSKNHSMVRSRARRAVRLWAGQAGSGIPSPLETTAWRTWPLLMPFAQGIKQQVHRHQCTCVLTSSISVLPGITLIAVAALPCGESHQLLLSIQVCFKSPFTQEPARWAK